MRRLAAFLLFAALVPLPAHGADKAIAQGLFERAQKTVITVRLVVKLTAGTRDTEQKVEAIGTVIDASGLTVVALAAIDPGSTMRAMLRARGGGNSDFKLESKVTETTLLLADGTELEADVVLKDADLGMAFVRPREEVAPMPAVALKAGRLPAVLDELILVGRFGRSANRAAWLDFTRVRAVVKGPRVFAICGENAEAALGTIAYGEGGEPAGVFVFRTGEADGGRSMLGPSKSGLVILRPVADLVEVAELARKAKSPAH